MSQSSRNPLPFHRWYTIECMDSERPLIFSRPSTLAITIQGLCRRGSQRWIAPGQQTSLGNHMQHIRLRLIMRNRLGCGV